jgi:hypothetical protein
MRLAAWQNSLHGEIAGDWAVEYTLKFLRGDDDVLSRHEDFGAEANEGASHAVLDNYFATGGDFIDTADVYANGARR